MVATGVTKFERFFRVAAGLDVDKADVKRYNDFLHAKLYDLLLVGQTTAKSNRRDAILPRDLPITKGLQESIDEFRKIDHEIELAPILEYIATRPQLDLRYSMELEANFTLIAGGLSVALARAFKIIDPDLKNPSTVHWERAFAIFNLLL